MYKRQEPYFARNGLEINAAVEMGTFLLGNGVCSYSGLGDGYNTADCYWEITAVSCEVRDVYKRQGGERQPHEFK